MSERTFEEPYAELRAERDALSAEVERLQADVAEAPLHSCLQTQVELSDLRARLEKALELIREYRRVDACNNGCTQGSECCWCEEADALLSESPSLPEGEGR